MVLLPGCIKSNQVLLGFTGLFYRVFIGSSGIYLVPDRLIWFYWVLPSLLVSYEYYSMFNCLITRL